MLAKLGSRKLWLAILGALGAVVTAACGGIQWSEAIKIVGALLGGYIGIEGIADALGRLFPQKTS